MLELAQVLGLEKTPDYIESYDISNLMGSENVAGMVVFKRVSPTRRRTDALKLRDLKDRMIMPQCRR